MPLVWLVLLGLLWLTPAQASVLSDAAQALAAGQWAELTLPSNIGAALGHDGSSGHILGYGTTAEWDPVHRRAYFCGMDHTASPQKCVAYDEATNAFVVMTTPPWTSGVQHGYDHNTLDIIGRRWYHRPFAGTNVYQCNLTSSNTCTTWTIAYTDGSLLGDSESGFEFIHWRGNRGKLVSFIWTSAGSGESQVHEWDPDTTALTTLTTLTHSPTSQYGGEVVQCTPSIPYICYLMIDQANLWTMNQAGTVTARATAPCNFDVQQGLGIVDPVTGRLLTWCGNSGGFHQFNPDTNVWSQISATTPPQQQLTANGFGNDSLGMSIPTYGVIMIWGSTAYGTADASKKVWIYKHASTSFASRCGAAGVLVCDGFDTAADFVPVTTGDGLYTGRAHVASRDTTIMASGASSLKITVPSGSDESSDFWYRSFSGMAEGETRYIQFRQRFDANMLNNGSSFGGNGWKQVIVHNHTAGSCALMEITTVNNQYRKLPIIYTECGAGVTEYSDGTDVVLQYSNVHPPGSNGIIRCYYNSGNPLGLSTNKCSIYQPNEWMTFYWRITVGTWGAANSTIQAWMGRPGYPLYQYINKSGFTLKKDTCADQTACDDGFNRVFLTTFDTGKQPVGHPTANTWYDELIVSTQPIMASTLGDGTGGGTDTTPPAAPTGVTIR